MSFNFTYAIIWASIILAPTSGLCPTYQCGYMVDIGFSLLADNEGNEEASTGWVPEPNRH